MSKTKPSGAAHYEILFIVSNRFTEEEAKTSIERVGKLITDANGQITKNEYWGKKRLAYPIKHEAYGYYQLFEFDLERPNLAALDEKLRLDHEVVRFMVVAKPLKTEAQLQKEQKINDKISSKKNAIEKEKVEKIKSQANQEVTKTKTPAKAKVDIDSLDEKLDDILNAEDLI